jgi:hypothetical protein
LISPDGTFATTAEDMARVLRGHWSAVFADKPVDRAELQHWSRATRKHAAAAAGRDDDWHVGEEHVLQAILHSNDSSPGPDGIP